MKEKFIKLLGKGKFRAASYIGLIIAVVAIAFYAMAYGASLQAAALFNRIMASQKLIEGNIQVETLSATPWGSVTFTNLKWTDDTDSNVVVIPEGSFKVKPWDVVWRQLKPSSITEATISDADMTFVFDDNMHIKGIRAMEEPKPKKFKSHKEKQPFDIKLKDMDVKISMHNCKLTALYQKRVFELDKVNADVHYDSDDKMDIDFSIGDFGGTLIGDGIILRGTVDLKPKISTCDLRMRIKELNPSSLGTGLNINEKVTAVAHVTGPVADPNIEGRLAMEELNLPGLNFKKLVGEYKYDDGLITANNVKAKIFGGTCDADGDFNIDTKAYNVNCLGHNLQGGMAAHTPLLSCEVELDLKMRCNGDNKSTETFGSFTSGKGKYAVIFFESISGSFHNQFNNLVFTDVVINTPLGEVMSPQFSLKKGKLRMGDIYLANRNTGEKVKLNI